MNKLKSEDFLLPEELDSKNTSFIYGEMNYIDIGNILEEMNLVNRLILDVGSGCGNLLNYLANKYDCNIDGIEIAVNRYLKSIYLLEDNNIFDKCYVYNDDFRNINFKKYDVIICCNIVFSVKDNNDLFNKLNNEFNGIAILNTFNNILKNKIIKITYIRTSWIEKQIIYILKI